MIEIKIVRWLSVVKKLSFVLPKGLTLFAVIFMFRYNANFILKSFFYVTEVLQL